MSGGRLVGAPGFHLRIASRFSVVSAVHASTAFADHAKAPRLSCGRLRRSSLVSAVDRWTALADHSFPPRLNLRFWRPPLAAAACSLTRARKSGRRRVGCFIKVGAPGFEPGTSASRTQRSTELSHAPKFAHHRPENVPAETRGRDHVRKVKRMGWDSNPRGY